MKRSRNNSCHPVYEWVRFDEFITCVIYGRYCLLIWLPELIRLSCYRQQSGYCAMVPYMPFQGATRDNKWHVIISLLHPMFYCRIFMSRLCWLVFAEIQIALIFWLSSFKSYDLRDRVMWRLIRYWNVGISSNCLQQITNTNGCYRHLCCRQLHESNFWINDDARGVSLVIGNENTCTDINSRFL